MFAVSETSLQAAQRDLLQQLLHFNDQQEQALSLGDLPALTRLSELRSQAVHEAADWAPPRVPWDAEVAELAAEVKARSESLQQALRDCMADVRRQLLALNEHQKVVHYLASQSGGQGASWQA